MNNILLMAVLLIEPHTVTVIPLPDLATCKAFIVRYFNEASSAKCGYDSERNEVSCHYPYYRTKCEELNPKKEEKK